MCSVVPVRSNFFVWCWEVSAAGGALLSSTVGMPALQKCAKCSCNVHVKQVQIFPWLLLFKLVLKPENAMLSSESCKNHMAECQACIRALESVDQS